ncbi:hypothetical protein IAR55_004772 [Kwoniella newhampshirensis]|uniref:Uncharacterized protein n=1 Tax=Kwoniella newhampshirensis TaxID=1651941 RepID=A0AAW0YWP6_9TREE
MVLTSLHEQESVESLLALSLTAEYSRKIQSYLFTHPNSNLSDADLCQKVREEMIRSHCPWWSHQHEHFREMYPTLAFPIGQMREESSEEYVARRFLRGAERTFGSFSDEFGMMGRVVVNAGGYRTLGSETEGGESGGGKIRAEPPSLTVSRGSSVIESEDEVMTDVGSVGHAVM